MGYTMKGSEFYGKGNSSPTKQLKEEYLQSEQSKKLFEGGYDEKGSDYEPTKPGEIRGIGTYVRNKKTGEVESTGMRSKPKKEKPTSEKVGPVESDKALAEKRRLSRETKVGPSGTEFDASDADIEQDAKERKASREARKYIKK